MASKHVRSADVAPTPALRPPLRPPPRLIDRSIAQPFANGVLSMPYKRTSWEIRPLALGLLVTFEGDEPAYPLWLGVRRTACCGGVLKPTCAVVV